MRRVFLAALLFTLTLGDVADAGPLRDRIAARRGCGQQGCAVAFPRPAAVAPFALSSCPGGACPAPARR